MGDSIHLHSYTMRAYSIIYLATYTVAFLSQAGLIMAANSPQEMVVLTCLGPILWFTFTWSTCQYLGIYTQPSDCLPIASEVGAVAAVAIPYYFWGDEEWNIARQWLGSAGNVMVP